MQTQVKLIPSTRANNGSLDNNANTAYGLSSTTQNNPPARANVRLQGQFYYRIPSSAEQRVREASTARAHLKKLNLLPGQHGTFAKTEPSLTSRPVSNLKRGVQEPSQLKLSPIDEKTQQALDKTNRKIEKAADSMPAAQNRPPLTLSPIDEKTQQALDKSAKKIEDKLAEIAQQPDGHRQLLDAYVDIHKQLSGPMAPEPERQRELREMLKEISRKLANEIKETTRNLETNHQHVSSGSQPKPLLSKLREWFGF